MRRAAVVIAILLLGGALPFNAEEVEKAQSAPVTTWLVAGGLEVPPAVYGKESKEDAARRLLGQQTLDSANLWPKEGESLEWKPGQTARWQAISAKDGNVRSSGGLLLYAATCLRVDRWTKATLKVASKDPLAVYLDGARLAERFSPAPQGKDTDLSAELELTAGLHRLFVAACSFGKEAPEFTATLEASGSNGAPLPNVTLSTIHPLSESDVLAAPFVSDIAVAGDGSKVALVERRTDVAADARLASLELRDAKDGHLITDYRAAKGLGSPYFSGDGRKLAFTAINPDDRKQRDLWVMDISSGSVEKLAEKLQGIKNVQFSPDGQFVYFMALAPKEKSEKAAPYERFVEPWQRLSDWDDRPQVYQLSMKDRVLRPLTLGRTNVEDYALSRDGSRLAVVRGVAVEHRPYLVMEVWLYDLRSGESKRLLSWERWPHMSEVAFSPDGKNLALIAPPADMPPGGLKPNERMGFDLQLFVMNLENPTPVNLTEGLRATVTSDVIGALPGRRNLWWSPRDGRIYFVATDRDRVRLYRCDKDGKAMEPVPLPDACLGSPDMSADGSLFVYNGSSFGTFWTVRAADLATGKMRDILMPGRDVFSRVELGGNESFDVLSRDGVPLQGWLFYPPHFDAKKKYPMIVAYYGGAMPYAECFRPEFFWLAGQGYVVYLVTPRGSIGYGREFADAHIDDWGELAGADIVDGVKAVLKHKPFVDSSRVGCYGGSYGGFMTLYLVSHSDLFAAAVDFFGISDITSYWGAGWWGWGFDYGDTALANVYPWSRRDIFVDRSPIYNADKIHSPLLLLHGDSDTNVPTEESDQIFSAMRVLGRTCEYVRFAGEDHGINGRPSNRVASETMMLEWFDRFLKNQPEAWQERWKNDKPPIEKE